MSDAEPVHDARDGARAFPLGRARYAPLFCLLLAFGSPASAQEEARLRISFKGGSNLESAEDELRGQSFGWGAAVSAALSTRWGLEFEAWIPASFDTNGATHRDLLFSASVIRRLAAERASPYVLVGLTAAKVEHVTPWGTFSNGHTYVQFGLGVEIPLASRLAVAPELRANASLGAVIVRPAVAAVLRF